jgi:hypothetical protein
MVLVIIAKVEICKSRDLQKSVNDVSDVGGSHGS